MKAESQRSCTFVFCFYCCSGHNKSCKSVLNFICNSFCFYLMPLHESLSDANLNRQSVAPDAQVECFQLTIIIPSIQKEHVRSLSHSLLHHIMCMCVNYKFCLILYYFLLHPVLLYVSTFSLNFFAPFKGWVKFKNSKFEFRTRRILRVI